MKLGFRLGPKSPREATVKSLIHILQSEQEDEETQRAIQECLTKIQKKGVDLPLPATPTVATTTAKESSWDSFDIKKLRNAGCKLKYVAPESIQGQVVGRIEAADVQTELEYWKTSVVCYVLGANPPFPIFNGFIKRVWGQYGIDKILMQQNGMFVIRFTTEVGRDTVLNNGILHFDKKPIILEPWTDNLNYAKKEVDKVPVWIRLENLELKYWNANSLSSIASLVGSPIMADSMTESRERIQYARLLVEVDTKKMPEIVLFANEKGVLVEQQVTYEWKPTQCSFCKGYGHEEPVCKKKKGKMMWRPKQKATEDTSKEVGMGTEVQNSKVGQTQPTGISPSGMAPTKKQGEWYTIQKGRRVLAGEDTTIPMNDEYRVSAEPPGEVSNKDTHHGASSSMEC